MANSKDGQSYKDKYKELVIRIAHVKYDSSNVYYFVMNNVYFIKNKSNVKVKRLSTNKMILSQ